MKTESNNTVVASNDELNLNEMMTKGYAHMVKGAQAVETFVTRSAVATPKIYMASRAKHVKELDDLYAQYM